MQTTPMSQTQHHILEPILIDIPHGEVRRQLHMKKGERWNAVIALIQNAQAYMKPQALYRVCFIDEKKSPTIIIQGVSFTSKILVKNLMDLERVFPYVVTIGKEFGDYLDSEEDLL